MQIQAEKDEKRMKKKEQHLQQTDQAVKLFEI